MLLAQLSEHSAVSVRSGGIFARQIEAKSATAVGLFLAVKTSARLGLPAFAVPAVLPRCLCIAAAWLRSAGMADLDVDIVGSTYVEFLVVAPRSSFSAQTLSVLAVLCSHPSQWQHGYALAKQTGLKSGTLYPILIRLADRGLVEACWEDEPRPGRPRRHLYRLTAEGLATANAALASVAVVRRQGPRPRSARAPGMTASPRWAG